jgi:hypothetical protein
VVRIHHNHSKSLMPDRRTRDYLRKYFIIHKSMPSSVTLRRLPPHGAGLKAFQTVSLRTCICILEENLSIKIRTQRTIAIIGFAPTLNALNLARSLAIYFTLWRKIHGPDSEVPFTGGNKAWTKKITLSPMDS